MNDPETGSFLHKRFPESRSRRLKDRVHRGLGRCLNKQKTICSVKVEWMVFRICNTDALLATIVKAMKNSPLLHFLLPASNAYGAPYAKTLNSASADLGVFCLLGSIPSPLNHKFLVSCAPCGRFISDWKYMACHCRVQEPFMCQIKFFETSGQWTWFSWLGVYNIFVRIDDPFSGSRVILLLFMLALRLHSRMVINLWKRKWLSMKRKDTGKGWCSNAR